MKARTQGEPAISVTIATSEVKFQPFERPMKNERLFVIAINEASLFIRLISPTVGQTYFKGENSKKLKVLHYPALTMNHELNKANTKQRIISHLDAIPLD